MRRVHACVMGTKFMFRRHFLLFLAVGLTVRRNLKFWRSTNNGTCAMAAPEEDFSGLAVEDKLVHKVWRLRYPTCIEINYLGIECVEVFGKTASSST